MSRTSLASRVSIGLVVATLALANVANAATVNKCNAAKRKCVAKLTGALLGCHAKAVKGGDPVDGECLQKAHAKFDGGTTPADGCFEKLETKYGVACLTQDDQATTEASVDAFVGDVVAALEPNYPAVVTSLCSAGKLKCVAQNEAALLGCQAKAALKGTLDPKCVLKAQQKFDGTLLDPPDATKGCFEKLEAKGLACLTIDDTVPLAQQVATVVDATQCNLDPLDPNCACPTRMSFTPDATDDASVADFGWRGLGHRQKLISNATVAFVVSGCPGASSPSCGSCTLTGPVDPPDREYRRCTGDTSVKCTSDTQCPALGTCAYFPGGPLPMSGGGVPNCLVTHINGPSTGTVNPDTGDGAVTMNVTTRLYLGIDNDLPCPRCAPDPMTGFLKCQGGPRYGLACHPDGTSPTPQFGDVSLDCPPQTGLLLGTSTTTVDSSTGFSAMTLTAAHPFCRATGATSKKCFCDTCNTGNVPNVIPCSTNTDCPDPTGPIGPICGGARCLDGSNDGKACTVASECPSGACGVPGAVTQPNSCSDGYCAGGICPNGPLDAVCAPTGTYKSCGNDFDCAVPGDTCSGLRARACFDNGDIGNAVAAVGTPSPTEPTWGSVSCLAPTINPVSNIVFGYPGLVRITQHGSMTLSNEPARRVFATSTVQSGALGGLAGADVICQARADAAALGGTFKAWLSDATTSAASRLAHAFGDYVLVDGTVVTHGWSDLADGTLLAAISKDELGVSVTGSAWTNATVAGLIDSAECGGWASTASGDFGQTGSTAATNGAWTDGVAFEDCVQLRHLYCIEQ